MEGIDRLHEIAEDVGRTVWLRELGAALSDIADGIEGGTRDLSGYEGDVLAWVEKNGGLDEVKERLMPEGYEWPRFEDGEPVRIGDKVDDIVVRSMVFQETGVLVTDGTSLPGWNKWRRYKEPFPRPAPKVLDADGVEIRVGDVVYGTKDMRYQVTELCEHEPSIVHAKAIEGGNECGGEFIAGNPRINSFQLKAEKLTHRAPILAADGKPLEVGQTVYHIADGKEYTVEKLFKDGAMVTPDGITGGRCSADYLTHERPDSFSLIEQDAELCPYDYARKYGKPDGVSNGKFQRVDLVRRAKALAERGQ